MTVATHSMKHSIPFHDSSLGVHISFVRSIAMDAWTPAQMKIMKAGGNDACNNFIQARGVSKTASIKEKYESDAAALYKEVIKARADGKPEPTVLVKKQPKARATTTSTSFSSSSSSNHNHSRPMTMPKPGEDPNGMEKLTGESDAAYIARQTKLRDQAKARMAAKFGNSSTNRTMGGVGSSPHYNPSNNNSNGIGIDSISDTLSSGFGTAASGLSSAFSFAKETVTSDSAKSVAKDVGSMGFGLWSSISSSAREVANQLNVEGLNLGEGESDGLAALSEKAKREKSVRGGSSKYSGFGSDASNGNNYGNATIPSPNTNMTRGANGNGNRNGNVNVNVNVTAQNQNDAAPLPGESDAQYMQRQMRIREEAKAKAAASAKKTTTTQRTMTPSKPAVAKMKVDSDDDFFSSFGA